MEELEYQPTEWPEEEPQVVEPMAKLIGRTTYDPEKRYAECFEFVLNNFSQVPHEIGASVVSPVFKLCGHNWHLSIYVVGETRSSSGFTSIYLWNDGQQITVEYRFEIFGGTPTATSVPIWKNRFIMKQFLASSRLASGNQSPSWGAPKSKSRDELLSRCVNNTITIRVTVRMIGDVYAIDSLLNPPNSANELKPPEKLLTKVIQDFGRLFESETNSDVILRVGNHNFKAHKAILSVRSPVLEVMFNGKFKESSTNSLNEPIVIEDINEETMTHLLQYIYTGSVNEKKVENFEQWSSILAAADRFNVTDLFSYAQFKLSTLLTPQNAMECLSLSMNFTLVADKLKTAALNMIIKNGVQFDAENVDQELMLEIMKHLNLVKPTKQQDNQLKQGQIPAKREEDDDDDAVITGEQEPKKRKSN